MGGSDDLHSSRKAPGPSELPRHERANAPRRASHPPRFPVDSSRRGLPEAPPSLPQGLALRRGDSSRDGTGGGPDAPLARPFEGPRQGSEERAGEGVGLEELGQAGGLFAQGDPAQAGIHHHPAAQVGVDGRAGALLTGAAVPTATNLERFLKHFGSPLPPPHEAFCLSWAESTSPF